MKIWKFLWTSKKAIEVFSSNATFDNIPNIPSDKNFIISFILITILLNFILIKIHIKLTKNYLKYFFFLYIKRLFNFIVFLLFQW